MFRDVAISKIKLLVCITEGKGERKLVDILHRNGARGIVELPGRGMASSEILQLLGLEDNERAVTLSLARVEDLDVIKAELAQNIYNKPGRGIALVLKVDGFIGVKTVFKMKIIEECIEEFLHRDRRED